MPTIIKPPVTAASPADHILAKFYTDHSDVIRGYAEEYLPDDLGAYKEKLKSLFLIFLNNENFQPLLNTEGDTEENKKARVLMLCVEGNPILFKKDEYTQYDLFIAGVSLQLPVLLGEVIGATCANGVTNDERVLEAAGVLELSNGSVLLYSNPSYEGSSVEKLRAIFENARTSVEFKGLTDALIELLNFPIDQFTPEALFNTLWQCVNKIQNYIEDFFNRKNEQCTPRSVSAFAIMMLHSIGDKLPIIAHNSQKEAMYSVISAPLAGLMQDIPVAKESRPENAVPEFFDAVREKLASNFISSDKGLFKAGSLQETVLAAQKVQALLAAQKAQALNNDAENISSVTNDKLYIPKELPKLFSEFYESQENNNDDAVLKFFFEKMLNAYQHIDKKMCDTSLYAEVLKKLWDYYTADNTPCPEWLKSKRDHLRDKITENNPQLLQVLSEEQKKNDEFLVRLKKIVNENATKETASPEEYDFAKTLETVATLWVHPRASHLIEGNQNFDIEQQEFVRLYSKNNVTMLRMAFDWVKKHPEYLEKNIRHYERKNAEKENVNMDAIDRAKMLKIFVPVCLSQLIVDNGNNTLDSQIGRVFNRNNLLLDKFLVSNELHALFLRIPDLVKNYEGDLEEKLLAVTQEIIKLALNDIMLVFPDLQSLGFSEDTQVKRSNVIVRLAAAQLSIVINRFTGEHGVISQAYNAIAQKAQNFLASMPPSIIESEEFDKDSIKHIDNIFLPKNRDKLYKQLTIDETSRGDTSLVATIFSGAGFGNITAPDTLDVLLALKGRIPDALQTETIADYWLSIGATNSETGTHGFTQEEVEKIDANSLEDLIKHVINHAKGNAFYDPLKNILPVIFSTVKDTKTLYAIMQGVVDHVLSNNDLKKDPLVSSIMESPSALAIFSKMLLEYEESSASFNHLSALLPPSNYQENEYSNITSEWITALDQLNPGRSGVVYGRETIKKILESGLPFSEKSKLVAIISKEVLEQHAGFVSEHNLPFAAFTPETMSLYNQFQTFVDTDKNQKSFKDEFLEWMERCVNEKQEVIPCPIDTTDTPADRDSVKACYEAVKERFKNSRDGENKIEKAVIQQLRNLWGDENTWDHVVAEGHSKAALTAAAEMVMPEKNLNALLALYGTVDDKEFQSKFDKAWGTFRFSEQEKNLSLFLKDQGVDKFVALVECASEVNVHVVSTVMSMLEQKNHHSYRYDVMSRLLPNMFKSIETLAEQSRNRAELVSVCSKAFYYTALHDDQSLLKLTSEISWKTWSEESPHQLIDNRIVWFEKEVLATLDQRSKGEQSVDLPKLFDDDFIVRYLNAYLHSISIPEQSCMLAILHNTSLSVDEKFNFIGDIAKGGFKKSGEKETAYARLAYLAGAASDTKIWSFSCFLNPQNASNEENVQNQIDSKIEDNHLRRILLWQNQKPRDAIQGTARNERVSFVTQFNRWIEYCLDKGESFFSEASLNDLKWTPNDILECYQSIRESNRLTLSEKDSRTQALENICKTTPDGRLFWETHLAKAAVTAVVASSEVSGVSEVLNPLVKPIDDAVNKTSKTLKAKYLELEALNLPQLLDKYKQSKEKSELKKDADLDDIAIEINRRCGEVGLEQLAKILGGFKANVPSAFFLSRHAVPDGMKKIIEKIDAKKSTAAEILLELRTVAQEKLDKGNRFRTASTQKAYEIIKQSLAGTSDKKTINTLHDLNVDIADSCFRAITPGEAKGERIASSVGAALLLKS